MCTHTYTNTHTHAGWHMHSLSLSLSHTHTHTHKDRQGTHTCCLRSRVDLRRRAASCCFWLSSACCSLLTSLWYTQQDKTVNIQQDKTVNIQQDKTVNIQQDKTVNIQQDKTVNIQQDKTVNIQQDKTVNIVSGISHSGTHNKTNGQHCVWYISLWYTQQDKRSTLCLVYLTLVHTTRQNGQHCVWYTSLWYIQQDKTVNIQQDKTVNTVSGIPHCGTYGKTKRSTYNKTKQSTLCLVYLTLVHTTRQNSQHCVWYTSLWYTQQDKTVNTVSGIPHSGTHNKTKQSTLCLVYLTLVHTTRQNSQHCVWYTSLWYTQQDKTVNTVSGIPHSGTYSKTKRSTYSKTKQSTYSKTKQSTLCLVYLTLVHTTRQICQHTVCDIDHILPYLTLVHTTKQKSTHCLWLAALPHCGTYNMTKQSMLRHWYTSLWYIQDKTVNTLPLIYSLSMIISFW